MTLRCSRTRRNFAAPAQPITQNPIPPEEGRKRFVQQTECLVSKETGRLALDTPLLCHRIRHSNFIERTFGETRRRTKVIGRFPGETSCVSIAWAVLDRASRGWRGLAMTRAGVRQLQDLRRSLLQPPRQLWPQHTPDSASSATA